MGTEETGGSAELTPGSTAGRTTYSSGPTVAAGPDEYNRILICREQLSAKQFHRYRPPIREGRGVTGPEGRDHYAGAAVTITPVRPRPAPPGVHGPTTAIVVTGSGGPVASRSVFVVVAVVRGVAMAVVDVVDMIAVRDGHMAAALTVHMVVAAVFGMRRGLAFVVVAGMLAVQMAVVDVVHVVAVRYRDMAAVRSVFVLVFGVLSMCRCHERSFFPRNGQLELRTQLHYQVRISADSHMFADLATAAARDTHTVMYSG